MIYFHLDVTYIHGECKICCESLNCRLFESKLPFFLDFQKALH